MSAGGNRAHGVIDDLPESTKERVNQKLVNGETYAEVTNWLNSNGVEVGKSSLGRYAARYLKAFERLQRARDFAKVIHEDGVDRPATELHEAAGALAVEGLLDIIIDTAADPAEKLKAARLLPRLQQAQTQTERLKIQARKENGAIKEALNALKTEVFESIGADYPEIAARIMLIADATAEKMTNA